MKTIKLGIPISLTGRYSIQATESFQGVQLFVKDVNSQGGLLVPSLGEKVPVELIYYDDQSSVDKCRELTERLIVNDGVDILLGPYSSSLAVAACEVAEAHGKTLWNHGGSTDEIEKRGFDCVISSISPTTSYMPVLVNLIRNVDNDANKIALLSASDSGFSQNVANGARFEGEKLGFEVKDFTFISGDENLRELVRDVQVFGPDLIISMGRMEDDIAVVNEIKSQRIKPKAIGTVASSIKLFRDTFGEYSEGFLSVSQWEKGLKVEPDIGPTPIEFSERFNTEFGKEPDYVAAQGYHIGLVIKHCILVTGSIEEESLRLSAKKEDLNTFYGRFMTDSSGNQRGHETVVTQWQDGVKVIVYPEHTKEAELIYPLK